SQSGGAAAVLGGPKFSWRMVTTWSSTLPVLSEGAKLFAQWVGEMSADRLTIRVYGDKELVPALQVFDAVSSGTAEMGHGASYYWQGKVPASPFFCTIPFGMNGQQMNAWLLAGDGLKLWEELYANYNLVPIPCGNTGVQMGGWFNKRIDTLSDLKGLKMRIPGLGARVIKLAGGSAQLSPGAEIYTNLERGVIDATEWIGPYHDYIMGFPRVAKYYYYPGWHEPGSVLELMINKQAYESLPGDLQAIVRSAALRANHWMLCEFEAKNLIYLEKIREEFKTEILAFPEEVLAALKVYAKQAIEELISDDPMSKKIYENYRAFHQRVSRWGEITEKVYYQER
nr:TRAP transporter substrate-binding protein [Calditrichia bacterium]